jgi:putative acetyltransferase
VTQYRPSLHLRPAAEADAEFIARVRHSAIREIAAAAYPREIIDAWSGPLTEARYQRFRQVIAGGSELMYVAEHQSRIVGFGSVIPAKNELRAIYVDPTWVRCGVGSAILRQLETVALESECRYLQLEASVNAKEFYLARGYIQLAEATHGVADDYAMACIVMRKPIG